MKRLFKNLAPAIFIMLGIYCGYKAADVMVKSHDERQAERARRIIDRGCIQTGLYGRSGEYKVYSCHGWIVREEDI